MVIIGIIAVALVLRYNLHMFQLNGYKNKEQIIWLKKNWRKQALLLVELAVGVLAAILFKLASFICFVLVLAVICRYYWYLKKVNTKKKLVYTMRVKRLIATNVCIYAVMTAIGFVFGSLQCMLLMDVLMFALIPVILILANSINKPIEKGVNQHYINDAKRILAQNPELVIIGVTGSYGKTGVKFYLQTLLQEKFNVLVTPESYNTPMGIVKTIRGSLKNTHEIFVCEMGARHVGDIKEITDFVHPTHGIITSIGPQHLDTFFSIENIIKTKYELADALPEKGMLFLNGDNANIVSNAANYKNKIYYALDGESGGYYAKNIELSSLGTKFTVVSPTGEEEAFQTRLVGKHNVGNILGAIAVANSLGVPLAELKIPVRRIQPVPHRMQLIERGNITIIDDAFNSNPVGSKAAVETLALFMGMKILITPGMVELGEKEEEYNYKFGTYAAKCCDYILLVGKKRVVPIQKGVLDSGFLADRCKVFGNLADAMLFATGIQTQEHKYILLENDLPDNY